MSAGGREMKIALIGAGAAGAACVSVLRSRGADFSLFEKARGAGGRLATRRVTLSADATELRYDHGAPFFNLTQDGHSPILQDLQNSKIIQPMEQGFTSCPDMPRMVKELLGNSSTHFNTEVLNLERRDDGWYVNAKIKAENDRLETYGPFDAVVSTAPTPQTLKIIEGHSCSWRIELQAVNYAPCWALMFSIRQGHFQKSFYEGKSISSLVLQNSKPGRSVPNGISSWVAYASPEWSTVQLETDNSLVLQTMLDEALSMISASKDQVIHSAAHRWRYSQTISGIDKPALFDDAAGLYYAGDACRGGGVEGALLSGALLGQHIAAQFSQPFQDSSGRS
jgi:hypothetical protein